MYFVRFRRCGPIAPVRAFFERFQPSSPYRLPFEPKTKARSCANVHYTKLCANDTVVKYIILFILFQKSSGQTRAESV